MKIGYIGAGKVGCSLGRYLAQAHELVGYASSEIKDTEYAAQLTGSKAFKNASDLARRCDTLFFTTPDSAIAQTWLDLRAALNDDNALKGKNLCHCSGAAPSTLFKGAHECGAFCYSVHPLFAVSSKTVPVSELAQAYFTIEGDAEHLSEITGMIEALGNAVQTVSTEDKVRYHAAAALASNHVVGIYKMACAELVKCGFSCNDAERALAPLLLNNAAHIAEVGPAAALTGPAERGDTATIDKHKAVLGGNTLEAYTAINEVLLKLAEEKHRLQK